MKRRIDIIILTLLVIVAIPYIVSFFSYRSSIGYAGNGIAYAMSDKTHYQAFKIVYFDERLMNRVSVNKGKFFVDGRIIEGGSKSLFLKNDLSTQKVEFSIDDYKVSEEFSSGILGLFGPVPHFKDYQVEAPKEAALAKLPG